MFDLTNLLTSGPVAEWAAKAGYNITEKISEVKSRKIWDDRIPLITDENYESMVVNETLTAAEEDKRVWFIVVTVTANGQEGISKFVDSVYDSAFDMSVKAGDLPHVRWGRIDYFNVTAVTTKWNIWSAPYLVVLTNRGKDLRFYRATQIRVNDEVMRNFLIDEGWRHQKPWRSAYSPGGSREWVMEYLAIVLTKTYVSMISIPKWLLYIITGGIGSVLIGFMHRSSNKPTAPRAEPKVVAAPSIESVPISSSSAATTSPKGTAKRGGTKSKKTTKK